MCALLVNIIESNVIKHDKDHPLAVNLKPYEDRAWTDTINSQDGKVRIARGGSQAHKKGETTVRVENRFALTGIGCPRGFVLAGTFCFPESDLQDY